jgi:hypothetical protein
VIAKAKDAENKARQAADTARKTAAAVAFFTAFSMLIGAFIAAVAATIAGHRRDEKLALRGQRLRSIILAGHLDGDDHGTRAGWRQADIWALAHP